MVSPENCIKTASYDPVMVLMKRKLLHRFFSVQRIDMVPGLLSSDLCSLRSNVDRFVITVFLKNSPFICTGLNSNFEQNKRCISFFSDLVFTLQKCTFPTIFKFVNKLVLVTICIFCDSVLSSIHSLFPCFKRIITIPKNRVFLCADL